MIKLNNKTRSSSKVGFLVKAVRGGFEYAGVGDTPIGVVTKSVPSGAVCNIQNSGDALVFVSATVPDGAQLRMPKEGEGGIAGAARQVGDEDSYTSIGYVIRGGRGLVRVALNIGGSAASASSGVQGATGTQGVQGPQGISMQGAQGWAGQDGLVVQGVQGFAGVDGVDGDRGLQGIQGIQGWQATQGAAGMGGY
jgi:hypothetical protein